MVMGRELETLNATVSANVTAGRHQNAKGIEEENQSRHIPMKPV
jgi:hypothetical protein